MNLKEQLKTGKKKIGVWGLGYIGFSTMAYFANTGISCVGTDPLLERVEDINKGKSTIPNFNFWLGFDLDSLVKNNLMNATQNWKELINEDIAVHIVTIPTEREGKPYHEILKQVIERLSYFKDLKTDNPPLVIVESTLTPTVAEEIIIPLFKKNGLEVGKDILFGVAPRRDWFTSSDKTLKTLPRVVGGTTTETTDLMKEVLGIICDTVIKAQDHKHAAMVKSIENAYRQLEITFANQLSLAYPGMNMTSILKMVGTKWNIGTFHPSFGTGGYCIPLAPQYVLEGAEYPEVLSLLKESLKTDFAQPETVVNNLIKRGSKKVAVLGIAYTGDLKVHVLSPGISIAKMLKEKGIDIKVNDPYYTDEEIKEITGCEAIKFPEGLSDRDTIVIVAPHVKYKHLNTQKILNNMENIRLVLDNMGIWNDMKLPQNIEYHEAGDAHWLK